MASSGLKQGQQHGPYHKDSVLYITGPAWYELTRRARYKPHHAWHTGAGPVRRWSLVCRCRHWGLLCPPLLHRSSVELEVHCLFTAFFVKVFILPPHSVSGWSFSTSTWLVHWSATLSAGTNPMACALFIQVGRVSPGRSLKSSCSDRVRHSGQLFSPLRPSRCSLLSLWTEYSSKRTKIISIHTCAISSAVLMLRELFFACFYCL